MSQQESTQRRVKFSSLVTEANVRISFHYEPKNHLLKFTYIRQTFLLVQDIVLTLTFFKGWKTK